MRLHGEKLAAATHARLYFVGDQERAVPRRFCRECFKKLR